MVLESIQQPVFPGSKVLADVLSANDLRTELLDWLSQGGFKRAIVDVGDLKSTIDQGLQVADIALRSNLAGVISDEDGMPIEPGSGWRESRLPVEC